jgi:hypothetical protein
MEVEVQASGSDGVTDAPQTRCDVFRIWQVNNSIVRLPPSCTVSFFRSTLDFLLSPLFPPFLRPEVCYLALQWWLSLLCVLPDHQMNHLNIFKSVLHP